MVCYQKIIDRQKSGRPMQVNGAFYNIEKSCVINLTIYLHNSEPLHQWNTIGISNKLIIIHFIYKYPYISKGYRLKSSVVKKYNT